MAEARPASGAVAVGPRRLVGRYELYDELASGGMATVHLGRLLGPVGFSRTVAIKRMHSQFARDPQFVAMFLDEARLAAKVRHPNVIATLDVVPTADEVFLVMEYVHGEVLSKLLRATSEERPMPPPIAVAIMSQVLQGLHAAHEARDESGRPLGIIHRDVSPQNVMVGSDGVARILDFGVAKANSRVHETRSGEIKGKLSYMAPEQIRGGGVELTRGVDIYAAGIVLWEMLTARRLFKAETEAETMFLVLTSEAPPVRSVAPAISEALEAVVSRALERDPAARFANAEEMAVALSRASGAATPIEVAQWLRETALEAMTMRAARVAEIERSSSLSGAHEIDTLMDRLRGERGDEIEVAVGSDRPPDPRTQLTQMEASASRPVTRQSGGVRWKWPALAGSLALIVALVVGAQLVGRRSMAASDPPKAAAPATSTSTVQIEPASSPSVRPSETASVAPPPSAAPSATATTSARPVARPKPPATTTSKPASSSVYNHM